MAFILFDMVSTSSYVFLQFVMGFNLVCDVIDYPIYVSASVGEFMVVTNVYYSCSVIFVSFQNFLKI